LAAAVSSNCCAAQGLANSLNKVYEDETHCLVGPEIRGEKDNSISCYCRDGLTDARYVYQTYLRSGKDRNLNGTLLTLWNHAAQMCGEGYGVVRAAEDGDWRWDGPEVIRVYPPDRRIAQIRPDSDGLRTVTYEVRLTYRDKQGQATKVETFSAAEKLPPGFEKAACPSGAVCPK
jgi:hypothetical protein